MAARYDVIANWIENQIELYNKLEESSRALTEEVIDKNKVKKLHEVVIEIKKKEDHT